MLLQRLLACLLFVAVQSIAAEPRPRLIYPNGLAFDKSNRLHISDIGAHQIFRLEGTNLALVAGTGVAGFSGDGEHASRATLNAPHELLFLADGTLLIADTFNHRIRAIRPDGTIHTIVGNGKAGHKGDGGAATEASLDNPQGIAADRAGNLYIADTFNHVVRRVDTNGIISTFAGKEAGLAGDGGPADKAQISLPLAVAVGPDGAVYISDGGNSRIRRVGADGTITTIMGFGPGSGNGGAGFSGDGGLASKAKLFSAGDLEFDAAGKLWISDSGNKRVRLLSNGVVMSIAGSGEAAFKGDGGPAILANFNAPQKVAVHPDGSIYIADRANQRVRRVDPAGRVDTVAGELNPSGVMLNLPNPAP